MVRTSKHSRRALKTLLARILNIRRLTIVVDNNPNREYILSLKNAVHACRRRNSNTLHNISLNTGVISPPKLLLHAMGALRHLTLEWTIISTEEIYFVLTALPRETLEVLRIWNSSAVRPFGFAKFLTLLMRWQRLQTLDLRGPIVNPVLDRSLDSFCRTCTLNTFAIDWLCTEHIAMLKCNGLKTLHTRIHECVTPEWMTQLPPSFNIVCLN